MDKNTFTKRLAKWLHDFLNTKFSDEFDILEVIIPESNLSKLPNEYIKSCDNYSSWEFKPDVVGILRNKASKTIEIVLLNRSTSALSLREIGEIHAYSKLIGSKLSLLVSLNGLSNEVNIILIEDDFRNRLLNYAPGKKIIIFSWDEKNDGINPNSIIPLDKKDFLLS